MNLLICFVEELSRWEYKNKHHKNRNQSVLFIFIVIFSIRNWLITVFKKKKRFCWWKHHTLMGLQYIDIKMKQNSKPPPFWLLFKVPECVIWRLQGWGKYIHCLNQFWNPQSSSSLCQTKSTHLHSSDTVIMVATKCSLITLKSSYAGGDTCLALDAWSSIHAGKK